MDATPQEWSDRFCCTPERQVYTFNEHRIPGLRMFGRHHNCRAIDPLPCHYHKNCFEFTYIVQGNITFFAGGQFYPLSGGELFITQPNEVHSTGNAPISLHRMYWFQLEWNDPAHFLFLQPDMAVSVLEQLRRLPGRCLHMHRDEEPLLRDIFDSIAQDTDLGRLQAAQMLGVFLCHVLRSSSDPGDSVTPDIRRAVDYIHAHLTQEIPMEELAKAALLSESRFKVKFKNQMGTSPRNYVNFQKMELARQMLRRTGSVTRTAMDLGFSSTNYFSVVFRRYTSLSPSRFLRTPEK